MALNIKTKKRLLIGVNIFLAVVFIFALSLFLYQRAYAGKMYRNVTFAGIDISGKTKTQVKNIVEEYEAGLLDNQFTTRSGDREFSSSYLESGVYMDSDSIVRDAYNSSRSSNFFLSLFRSARSVFKKTEVPVATSFDPQAYNQFSQKVTDELKVPAVDASLTVKNGQVVASASQSGLTVDPAELKNEIADGFTKDRNFLTIELPTQPVTPALLEASTEEAKLQAETLLAHQLTILLNNQTYSADRVTIGSWISFTAKSGSYTAGLDQQAIKSYIAKLAAKNDTPTVDTKINAVDNSVLQEGRQGIYTDQDDGVRKIVAALSSTAATATIQLIQSPRDPQVVRVFPNEGIVPGRFPGKYIDVDVAQQIMTLFEGANQIGQYQVSSGKASMPTPTGTRSIVNKSPRAWSEKYGLWMPWWMGIGGEYGIHELPEWPNGYKEGEAHLGTPVSHGCVRLGVGPAQTVYNWAEIGIPVYIHK